MNIYAKQGHKVVYANPQNGYKSDQHLASHNLWEGKTYTVSHTIVSGFSTEVYLEEVPNIPFNSVMFEDADTYEEKWNE